MASRTSGIPYYRGLLGNMNQESQITDPITGNRVKLGKYLEGFASETSLKTVYNELTNGRG